MRNILLTITLASSIFAASGREYGARLNDNISWTLQDSVLTISGTGAMPSYVPNNADRNCFLDEDFAKKVHTIIIEDGITEIGSYSFGQRVTADRGLLYDNLRTIKLPSSLRKIGHHAFTRIPVSNIVLPEGLEDIDASAFANCIGLRSIKLPSTLKHLGPEAFLQCSNLIGVDLNFLNIPLGTGVFFNCENLQLICHPENIKKIAKSTFNATRLNDSNPDKLLEVFRRGGLEHTLSQGGTARDYYLSDAENMTSMFQLDDLSLEPFDAESSTARINTVCHGSFIVPLTPGQYDSLRDNWEQISLECQPAFLPRKGRLILQSVFFMLPDETKLIAAPLPAAD